MLLCQIGARFTISIFAYNFSNLQNNIMKAFKDQLDQCLRYARAYNQLEKLKGSFVLDLPKRLPFEAKQRYLDFFLDRYGCTSEPTYQSLVDFVEREELCKSTDLE